MPDMNGAMTMSEIIAAWDVDRKRIAELEARVKTADGDHRRLQELLTAEAHKRGEDFRRAEAAEAALERVRSEPCIWSEDEDGYWNTACGEAWILNDGGPSDNRCNYCFYCGKPIEEKLFVYEDDLDAAMEEEEEKGNE